MSAQGLPAHILALFTPRPPPQHLPPQVIKHKVKLTGCSEYVDYFSSEKPPKREAWESPLERRIRRHKEKLDAHQVELQKLIDKYDPHKDANAVGDPFKTLFVARISYDTTEKKLKREFEVFGSIKRVRMVYDLKGKPRGYAFIEYEHERDLKNAYKQGDGKKIDGRRVMVDVERGRTVEGWMPRRLGGGRGPGRVNKPSKKKKMRMLAANQEKEKEKEKEKEPAAALPRQEKHKDKENAQTNGRERHQREPAKEKAETAPREKERDREKDRGKEKDRENKDRVEKVKEKDRGEKEKERKRERSRSRDRDGDRDRDRKKSRREKD